MKYLSVWIKKWLHSKRREEKGFLLYCTYGSELLAKRFLLFILLFSFFLLNCTISSWLTVWSRDDILCDHHAWLGRQFKDSGQSKSGQCTFPLPLQMVKAILRWQTGKRPDNRQRIANTQPTKEDEYYLWQQYQGKRFAKLTQNLVLWERRWTFNDEQFS